MAARRKAPKPTPTQPAPEVEATEVDAATAPQTEDYTRRVGGYLLTERGWVLENKE